MTPEQSTQLLAYAADNHEQTQALGQLLAQNVLYGEIVCVLLLCIMFLVAIHRPK